MRDQKNSILPGVSSTDVDRVKDIRVFCIALVKDEADVIEECLNSASTWAHRIFVFDNGSSDGTWDIVTRLAATNDRIVPYKSEACVFRAHLRGEVFKAYRHLCREGDWWCVLDADEFYFDDPRSFLARVPERHQSVWHISVTFGLTEDDLKRLDNDGAEPRRSLPERLRHYRVAASEPRFFRHHDYLVWPETRIRPWLGAIHPERIPTMHFPVRTPEQLQRRIAVRKAAIAAGSPNFRHLVKKSENWRDYLMKPERARLHAGDGRFVVEPGELRPLPWSARAPAWAQNLAARFRATLNLA